MSVKYLRTPKEIVWDQHYPLSTRVAQDAVNEADPNRGRIGDMILSAKGGLERAIMANIVGALEMCRTIAIKEGCPSTANRIATEIAAYHERIALTDKTVDKYWDDERIEHDRIREAQGKRPLFEKVNAEPDRKKWLSPEQLQAIDEFAGNGQIRIKVKE